MLSKDDVNWIYQTFLHREVEGQDMVDYWIGLNIDIKKAVEVVLDSEEYAEILRTTVTNKALKCRLAFSQTKFNFLQPFNIYDRIEVKSYATDVIYEEEESEYIDSLCQPGDYVVDVGCRHGWFSGIMASKVGAEGKVFSFDPGDFSHYIQNLRDINNFQWINFYPIALGDRTDQTFYDPRESKIEQGSNRISIMRMDDVLCCLPKPITFIKMDIEGAEFKALLGAKELISKDRPIILMEIFEEFQKQVSGVSVSELLDLIDSYGYQVYDLSGKISLSKPKIYDRLQQNIPINVLLKYRAD